jgi:hypothetical protein
MDQVRRNFCTTGYTYPMFTQRGPLMMVRSLARPGTNEGVRTLASSGRISLGRWSSTDQQATPNRIFRYASMFGPIGKDLMCQL